MKLDTKGILTLLLFCISIAEMLAKTTPTEIDDRVIAFIKKIINLLLVNPDIINDIDKFIPDKKI